MAPTLPPPSVRSVTPPSTGRCSSPIVGSGPAGRAGGPGRPAGPLDEAGHRDRQQRAEHAHQSDADEDRDDPAERGTDPRHEGEEVHEDVDQILTFVSRAARISGNTTKVAHGDLVVGPAGTEHDVVDTGPNALILYTGYGPGARRRRGAPDRAGGRRGGGVGGDQPPTG